MKIKTYSRFNEKYTCYTKNGKLHRLDGAAVVFHNEPEYNEHWIDGVFINIECWKQVTETDTIDYSKIYGDIIDF